MISFPSAPPFLVNPAPAVGASLTTSFTRVGVPRVPTSMAVLPISLPLFLHLFLPLLLFLIHPQVKTKNLNLKRKDLISLAPKMSYFSHNI